MKASFEHLWQFKNYFFLLILLYNLVNKRYREVQKIVLLVVILFKHRKKWKCCEFVNVSKRGHDF